MQGGKGTRGALGTHLQGPVFRWSFIDNLHLAMDVRKLHVLALIDQEQLQGVRRGSEDCVCPGAEPVGVKHLPVAAVLPQRSDPGVRTKPLTCSANLD